MTTWLPEGFEHPRLVPVPPDHHLRPIRASDVDIDFVAVMGSRDRLWSVFGEPHGWPAVTLTREEDRADLERHEEEMRQGRSFNYALLNEDETVLAGCVYLDPPERVGADADISYWVVDALVGSPVASALDALLPAWIAGSWPFVRPRIIGLDLSWEEWLSLPPE